MEPLFYNTNFLVGKKPIFYRRWYENKIFVVNDILNEDGSFMDYNTFNLIYGMRAHFLEYNGLLASVKDWVKKTNNILVNLVARILQIIFYIYLTQQNLENYMTS